MKNTLFILGLLAIVVIAWRFDHPRENINGMAGFTNVRIKNSSTTEPKVKVYVTLQSPNSVVGLFGITDTIGTCSKGYFYAKKGITYSSMRKAALLGAVISFGADNLPCQVAVPAGYPTGINIFEFSINTPFEVFDISCEDGVNSILRATVTDTTWSTGDGLFIKKFTSAQNKFPLVNNLGIRGVFPYRCTDCVDIGSAPPQNCFNLPDACDGHRTCQVARTNMQGGNILIEYMGKAK